MSKLFQLREWLAIPEAAKHLSVLFGEEVAEADILRLGLDGHLKLSVNLVNEILAEAGSIVPISEAKLTEGLVITDEIRALFSMRTGRDLGVGKEAQKNQDQKYLVRLGYRLNDKEIVQFEGSRKYLRGVWDLCMLEGEKFDIEELYYEKIGAPFVDRWTLGGVLVTKGDGKIYRLVYELEKPSKEAFDKETELVQANLRRGGHGNEAETDRMVNEHAQYRKKLWENQTPRYGTTCHLPADGILVVRTEALREFEQSLRGVPVQTVKVADNTLVATIAALLAAFPKGKKPSGKDLEKAAASVGVSVSDDSIRKALNLAKDIAPSLKSA